MIYSMTGYGQSSRDLDGKKFRFEVKSLNGKNTDIRLRSTDNIMNREIELRKVILQNAIRGKFDAHLVIESAEGLEDSEINQALMQKYYHALKGFADTNNIDQGDILQSIIRLPNVVQTNEEALSDQEWMIVKQIAEEAVQKLMNFRSQEGESIKKDISERANNIINLLNEVGPYEEERIGILKERIKKNLKLHLSNDNIDENRFEQELIFYIEKIDINEEKVRLAQHCKYFLEEVSSQKIEKGKKLSFIAQEMGREINTLGAKAQHPEIQQVVVKMKDQLEKIKEQMLNIV